MTTQDTPKPPRIVPLNEVPSIEGYGYLKIPTLRQWVFRSAPHFSAKGEQKPSNGFDACLVRIGRRVYVNLDSLDTWLLSHQKPTIMEII